MDKVKAVVYGAGTIGRDVARLMLDKGVIITDAIDIENVGEDLGSLLDIERDLNVEIRDDADAVLDETGADIALISVATKMGNVGPHIEKCLEAGLNVITSSEEASYPWSTAPGITAKLDRVAKENGVTVTGSGMQDIFWANLVTTLTGASHEIDSVEGRLSVNVDELGEMVADFYAVGREEDEIREMIEAGEDFPLGDEVDFLFMDLENQISALGLTTKSFNKVVEPITLDKDIESEALGETIPAGDLIGLDITFEVETQEGIMFKGTQTAKVYQEGDQDYNEWVIKGEPDIHVRNENPPTLLGTSTQIVNRIPDVINAKPGFVTIDQLPMPKCKVRSLEHYIE